MFFTHKEWQFCFQSFWNLSHPSLIGFLKTLRGEAGLKVIFFIVVGGWGKLKSVFYDKGRSAFIK